MVENQTQEPAEIKANPYEFYLTDGTPNPENLVKLQNFYIQPEIGEDGKIKIDSIPGTFLQNFEKLNQLKSSRDLTEQSQLILGANDLSLVVDANPRDTAKGITISLEDIMDRTTISQSALLTHYTLNTDPEALKRQVLSKDRNATTSAFTIPTEYLTGLDEEETGEAGEYNAVAKINQGHQGLMDQSNKLGDSIFGKLYTGNLNDSQRQHLNFLMGGKINDLDQVARKVRENSAHRAVNAIFEFGVEKYTQKNLETAYKLKHGHEEAIETINETYRPLIAGSIGERKASFELEKSQKLGNAAKAHQYATQDAKPLYRSFTTMATGVIEKKGQRDAYEAMIRKGAEDSARLAA